MRARAWHTHRRQCKRLVHSLVVLAVFWAETTVATALSPLEVRGKQIFLTGSSASGRDITAYIGHGSIPVPASAFPCANCHGPDGLGRPEGGVMPSNITWGQLTKPYSVVSATGRRRPAYTTETLARAITAGLDSAGNRLDTSMPRFRMAAEDMADLMAYLQRLETDLDPGLTDTRITLGTVVPNAGALQSLGQAIQAVLKAYFTDLNAQGGIYGRTLDLTVSEAESRTALLEQGKELIEGQQVFALVGAFTAGMDDDYVALVERHQVPLLGPFTQFPQDETSLQRFTFYLYGGLTVQGRALVDYASRQLRGHQPRLAVVNPAGTRWADVAQAIETQAGKHSWQDPLHIEYTQGRMDAGPLARQLQASGVEALFFFGATNELLALAREAEGLAWAPYVFLVGSLVDNSIFQMPLAFQDKIFLAYATTQSNQSRAGVQEFSAFQRRHGLPQRHLPAQIATYTAAKLLVEGLKRAGRHLSRAKLIATLEKMYEYDTGLTPQLTYGPNRRIGALGAHIMALDLAAQKFVAGSAWIVPE